MVFKDPSAVAEMGCRQKAQLGRIPAKFKFTGKFGGGQWDDDVSRAGRWRIMSVSQWGVHGAA